MSFKSHIYDRSEIEESSQNWPLFFLLVLFCVLGYLLTDISKTLGIATLLLSTVGIYSYLYRDWGKKEREGKYVGEIILTGDTFILNKETIKTSEISEMKIEIAYTKGHKHWSKWGYTVDSGTNSRLELTVKGKRSAYNFQLYTDGQIRDLKKVIEELYARRIFVKEFYLGERTYLLEELNYEEIQEFKKKYKLY
jgi:hypothetical protein